MRKAGSAAIGAATVGGAGPTDFQPLAWMESLLSTSARAAIGQIRAPKARASPTLRAAFVSRKSLVLAWRKLRCLQVLKPHEEAERKPSGMTLGRRDDREFVRAISKAAHSFSVRSGILLADGRAEPRRSIA